MSMSEMAKEKEHDGTKRKHIDGAEVGFEALHQQVYLTWKMAQRCWTRMMPLSRVRETCWYLNSTFEAAVRVLPMSVSSRQSVGMK